MLLFLKFYHSWPYRSQLDFHYSALIVLWFAKNSKYGHFANYVMILLNSYLDFKRLFFIEAYVTRFFIVDQDFILIKNLRILYKKFFHFVSLIIFNLSNNQYVNQISDNYTYPYINWIQNLSMVESSCLQTVKVCRTLVKFRDRSFNFS